MNNKVKFFLISGMAVFCSYKVSKCLGEKRAKEELMIEQAHKDGRIIKLYHQWMKIKQMGKSVENFLLYNNYKTIAIYGMGYLGKSLYVELNDSEINIAYIIDKNKKNIDVDVDVYGPEDILPKVDLVIVTSIAFMDEIVDDISGKVSNIVSLEDMLYGME